MSPPAKKSRYRATRSTRQCHPDPKKDTASDQAPSLDTDQDSSLTKTDISTAQELLRQFDMILKYGPCVGITRSVRWERAKQLGLDPPERVNEILKKKLYQQTIIDLELHLWHKEL
jgi:DNA polymerase delta subunit 4